MKKSLITLAAVTAALFSTQAVFAQEAPKKREDVKAETKAAVKEGAVDKGQVTLSPAKAPSEKARADVKKEAAAAEKAGTIPVGEKSAPMPAPKSEKARADVKKDTASAVKAGEISKGQGDVKK